ncbi:helix-turn-helix domain-containing protein [Rubellimicrobium mesophilum]|uniref:helix-turn-helix domain-containing protein n=1 Tax=Rubellimicrobium mesophilum TaxID=1123067 RepID=UPI000567320E|nr:helix-turn-helix transcriptional regulator [Rubellimicrobium mesophilum]
MTRSEVLTGAKLRAGRKALRMSQAELARRTGYSRDTVRYWEKKGVIEARCGAFQAFVEALGLRIYSRSNARARIWGLTLLQAERERLEERVRAERARLREREVAKAAHRRVCCGARTRKGRPCRLLSEPGRRRCKFHGGKSTGPRTAEGRARIAEAQRTRWARWRREMGKDLK